MGAINWRIPDATKPIIFIHIPRTAGTSFRWASASFYGNEKVGLIHPGYHTVDTLLEIKDQLQLITGHIDVSNPIFEHMSTPFNMITILRDPLYRFLSFFHYGVNKESFVDHESIKERQLEELILDPNCEYHNGMCYQIGGLDRSRYTPKEALIAAKTNLETIFTVFGFTELFPELIAIMYRRFGWNGVIIRQEEHVEGVPRPHDLDTSLLELLKKNNQEDIALFEFAKKLYEDRRLQWLA